MVTGPIRPVSSIRCRRATWRRRPIVWAAIRLSVLRLRRFPPDTDPPYFENLNPPADATDVDYDECIGAIIKDSGAGVDSSTIVLTVNGEEIDHEDYSIVELGTGRFWYSIEYCPPGGLIYSSMYTVEVEATDLAPAANSDDVVWTFIVEDEPPIEEFTWNLKTLSIDGADTARTNLFIGIDNLGTFYYDSGLDVPQFLFPGAPRGYFPLDDPAHPAVTALSTDIRSTESSIKEWVVDVFEPDDDLVLEWDNDALPLPPTVAVFQYAVADSGSFPSSGDYRDMSLYDHADFDPDKVVFIRMLPGGGDDTDPPVIREISHTGSEENPLAPLCFEIVDYGSGVDNTTFLMTVDDTPVDMADIDVTPISSGYRYCYMPDGDWSPWTTYCIAVAVDDNAPSPNHLSYSWCFTTGLGGCAPEFELDLQFTYGPDPDETEVITLGMDGEATDDFDAGIDMVMPPPVGNGFYFVGTGTAPRDKLVKDIRNTCEIPSIWEVMSVTGDTGIVVTWNPAAPIFGEDTFEVYYKLVNLGSPAPDSVDDTWTNLEDVDSISYANTGASAKTLYIGVDAIIRPPEFYTIQGNVTLFGETDHSDVEVRRGISTIYTDSSGFYQFSYVSMEPTCHKIHFSKTGFEPDSVTVCNTVPDTVIVRNITLYPPHQMVYGNITVDGAATAGVTVLLYNSDSTYFETEFTEPSSDYSFDVVPPDNYCLTASYPLHASWDTCFTVSSSDVEINHDLDSTKVLVTGTGSLSGVPTEGITISVDGFDCGTTDSLGYYEVLADIGTRTICANYPGYIESCRDETVPVSGLTGIDFNLLPAPIDLTVNVVLECGPEDVTVTITGVGSEFRTGSGAVTFEGLDHGCYTVEVSADYHKTVTVDSVCIYADDEIDVVLCCLDPVTDFTATGDSVQRPSTEALSIVLEWTQPDTDCCMPVSYEIYRAEVPFIDPAAPGVYLLETVPYDTGTTITYIDETVEDGEMYFYDIRVVYDCESVYSMLYGNETAMSFTYADPNDILVIDWDNGATPVNGGTMGVGEWWEDMLTDPALGVDDMGVVLTDDDSAGTLDYYNLDDYDLVVVALGINDADNTLLPASMLDKLDDYRAGAGNAIIVEGPDFGEDYDGVDFFDNLGLDLVHPGAADFNVDYFWGYDVLWNNIDITFDYDDSSLADHFVDVLAAVTPSVAVGWDQDTIPRVFYYDAGGTRALVGAVYLGGIVEDAGHTQLRAVSGYLWKVGIANTYVFEVGNEIPREFTLGNSYPNPFNPITNIEFDVAKAADVEIDIFDITGKKVATVVNEQLKPGKYVATWDGSGMPSGIYFARMTSDNYNATKKLMLVK
ncbi:hypothetical protein DRQ36_02025 [bacterium]|nr:MAG: hypothetical protein DRQ36_02025 [bacterium]